MTCISFGYFGKLFLGDEVQIFAVVDSHHSLLPVRLTEGFSLSRKFQLTSIVHGVHAYHAHIVHRAQNVLDLGFSPIVWHFQLYNSFSGQLVAIRQYLDGYLWEPNSHWHKMKTEPKRTKTRRVHKHILIR